MSVKWLDPGQSAGTGVTIVSAAGYPRLFCALSSKIDFVRAEVHYVPELARSLPHEDGQCRWCKYPALEKWWLPVLMAPETAPHRIMQSERLSMVCGSAEMDRLWIPKVLELPPSALKIVPLLERGSIFAVVRGLDKNKKKVTAKLFSNQVIPETRPFDCRPFLLNAWSLKERYVP